MVASEEWANLLTTHAFACRAPPWVTQTGRDAPTSRCTPARPRRPVLSRSRRRGGPCVASIASRAFAAPIARPSRRALVRRRASPRPRPSRATRAGGACAKCTATARSSWTSSARWPTSSPTVSTPADEAAETSSTVSCRRCAHDRRASSRSNTLTPNIHPRVPPLNPPESPTPPRPLRYSPAPQVRWSGGNFICLVADDGADGSPMVGACDVTLLPAGGEEKQGGPRRRHPRAALPPPRRPFPLPHRHGRSRVHAPPRRRASASARTEAIAPKMRPRPSCVALHVDKSNDAARGLYASVGFEVVADVRDGAGGRGGGEGRRGAHGAAFRSRFRRGDS